jgi:hypothetical protein
MREKYKHSGKVPPLGVGMGLLMGIIFSIPLAYAYDYGIINVPYIKLRMIFTFLFGLLAGIAVGWGLTLGKVRNGRVAGLMGVVVSLAALYISWGAWLLMVFQMPQANLFALLGRPAAIWRLLLLVNVTGTWSMSGFDRGGIMLWVFWVLEALTIVVCGLAGAFLMVKRRPFCENCDHWCPKAGQILVAATMAPADLMANLNQGKFDFLKLAAPATVKQAHYTLAWHSCPTCGALNTLTVSQVLPKNNKVLASDLLVSPAEIEALTNWRAANSAVSSAAKTK